MHHKLQDPLEGKPQVKHGWDQLRFIQKENLSGAIGSTAEFGYVWIQGTKEDRENSSKAEDNTLPNPRGMNKHTNPAAACWEPPVKKGCEMGKVR